MHDTTKIALTLLTIAFVALVIRVETNHRDYIEIFQNHNDLMRGFVTNENLILDHVKRLQLKMEERDYPGPKVQFNPATDAERIAVSSNFLYWLVVDQVISPRQRRYPR